MHLWVIKRDEYKSGGRMRDVCKDTVPCYNSSRLPVTVSEDEIWQRDAAVGECPVSRGDGKTDITTFLMQIFALGQTQLTPGRQLFYLHKPCMASRPSYIQCVSLFAFLVSFFSASLYRDCYLCTCLDPQRR